MLGKGVTFVISESGKVNDGPREVEVEKAALRFVRQLVDYMKKGLQLAQTNTLMAAKTAPIHGNETAFFVISTLTV